MDHFDPKPPRAGESARAVRALRAWRHAVCRTAAVQVHSSHIATPLIR
jgi:hypothetical protein